MESKIVFVGYCPSHRGSPEKPLDGPGTGHRLAALCGMSHEGYLRKFERVNLHYDTPLKRDSATKKRGELSAAHIRHRYRGRRIILLGHEVLEAFGLDQCLSIAVWSVVMRDETRVSFIPHPSGLNRWYNDKKNIRRVEKFLRGLV